MDSGAPRRLKPFVSLFCYPLGKEANRRHFNPDELVTLEVAAGDKSLWAGFRTLHWLRTLLGAELADDMVFYAEHSTLIAKARSFAAAQFLRSDCDVWVSIDDDAATGPRELALLVEAAYRHGIAVLPQLRRDGRGINVIFSPSVYRDGTLWYVRSAEETSRIAPIDFAGCSLMACSRNAIESMRLRFPELDCVKQSPAPVLALFLETVQDLQWEGEDAAFFRRAKLAGIEAQTLIDCETEHAGLHLGRNWFERIRPELAATPLTG